MNTTATIQETVRDYLCTGCGTCAGICPEHAIEMVETPGGLLRPAIKESECAQCGLCLRVCPGPGLAENVTAPLRDPFVGNVLKAYTGYALDPELRLRSQSGGIVTALLLHALDSRQIDGAVVTRLSTDGSLRPYTFIASEPIDILSAQKSKYCPVAANIVLAELLKTGKKAAFVGLPCHVHGLRNAQSHIPAFRHAVSVTIGLFCQRTLSFGALEYLVHRGGMSRRRVVEFAYRDKRWRGWPGDIFLRDERGQERYLPRVHRFRAKDAFTPLRCRLCFDHLNFLADISLGDAWGFPADNLGISSIIARTECGNRLLNSAAEAGVINMEECDARDLVRGQAIERRRRDFAGFSSTWSGMGYQIPRYHFSANPGLALKKSRERMLRRLLRQCLFLETVAKRESALRRARLQILGLRMKGLLGRALGIFLRAAATIAINAGRCALKRSRRRKMVPQRANR